MVTGRHDIQASRLIFTARPKSAFLVKNVYIPLTTDFFLPTTVSRQKEEAATARLTPHSENPSMLIILIYTRTKWREWTGAGQRFVGGAGAARSRQKLAPPRPRQRPIVQLLIDWRQSSATRCTFPCIF